MVKRGALNSALSPRVASITPSTVIISALAICPVPAKAATAAKPTIMRAKYSAEWNSKATVARPGANPIRRRAPTVPPAKRRDGGDGQRLAGLPLARQGVSVKRRGDGTGDSRRVDQNGRGGAAEDGAVIDPGKQDQRRRRIPDLDGDRDHDRDDRHRTKTRKHADQCADQAAGHHHEQVLKGEAPSQDRSGFPQASAGLLRKTTAGGEGKCPTPPAPDTR